MKILQVNAVHSIRSTGRQVSELCNYFNDKNNYCLIAYSEGDKIINSYQISKKIDKKIHAFLSRMFGNQAYYSRKATFRLVSYISSFNPDVIHLNNLHANYINLKILLNYIGMNNIPTVITLHDCWFYTGKCTHYTLDNCYKWREHCGNCPRLKKDNVSWFFDRTTKMLTDKEVLFGKIPRLAVVGVSKWITNEAKKSILKDSKIIETIYNWIDLGLFKPVDSETTRIKLNLEGKYIILGVASNWSESKGLNLFIELSKIISENDVILLVGNVSKKIQLNHNIVNIKELNDAKELVKMYSMSDVFVNLSKEESFGKVTAEALACGLPIITNNYTANPELVSEDCGIVLEEIKADEILEAIMVIKSHGKEFYSKNCIARAKRMFNYQDRAQDYLNLYERLIESGD